MSNQTEELLRAGMERFTDGVDLPSGLAARAVRHRRRRRVANGAAAAAAVATAAGVAVALVVATAPAPAATTGVETAAYVVNHTEAALAQADSQNLIQYVHVVTAGGVHIAPGGVGAGRSGVDWTYRGRYRVIGYDSRRGIAGETGSEQNGSWLTSTTIDHQNRTWWRSTIGVKPAPAREPSCQQATMVTLSEPQPGWATALHAALRCGQYTIAGTQRIDGVLALELKPAPKPGFTATFWVDPASYLPVRELVSIGSGTITNDFRWLRPTRANLADLAVTIPPGYTRIQPPSPARIFRQHTGHH